MASIWYWYIGEMEKNKSDHGPKPMFSVNDKLTLI